jgi:hypothetical protein
MPEVPEEILKIILQYKKEMDELEAFLRFFDIVFSNLIDALKSK